MPSRTIHRVMLSSTYAELEDHRRAVREAMVSQEMHPVSMENDAALPGHDLISASLAKVDEAEAYVGLISYRYGQTPHCPDRNPDGLSLTELEFRRAVERKIPICMFLMGGKHTLTSDEVDRAALNRDKLAAFKERATKDRIYAEFLSVQDLKAKAVQSLVRLREALDKRHGTGAAGGAAAPPPDDLLPEPPALHAAPPYLPSHDFVGRAREIGLIDAWARSADPLLVFEAIGGMGKSMLTWRWLQDHAGKAGTEWAGLLWYSFYETGADMHDFCVTALAYAARKPKSAFEGRRTADLANDLLRQLQAKPWLMVLDGLERVLVAYNRYDAAQAADDAVDADPDTTARPPESCIRPEDDDLLQRLAAARPSKLLVSSRLMPRALLNNAGVPRPGVAHVALAGLAPEDAERMMRDVGVRGQGDRMQAYLQDQFGCHPLVVGVVAGLVFSFPPAPGDFDRWIDDPDGGDEVNLAKLDLRQRRNHVLAAAFRDLDPNARDLLGHLALISDAVDWEVLEALNPRRPPRPEPTGRTEPPDEDWYLRFLLTEAEDAQSEEERAEREREAAAYRAELEKDYQADQAAHAGELRAWERSDELRDSRRWLHETLVFLQRRGLLQCDRQAARYDLHPVVRHYAVGTLGAEARGTTGERVADFFASRPAPAYESAQSLKDVANSLHVVRALNSAGRAQRAFEAVIGPLNAVLHRLEFNHELLALLRPLFREGWKEPIEGLESPEIAADVAARVLHDVGRIDDAAPLITLAILKYLETDDLAKASDALQIFGLIVGSASPAGGERATRLALEVAEAQQDHAPLFWCRLRLCNALANRGLVAECRSAKKAGRLDELCAAVGDKEALAHLTLAEVNLLRREGRLDASILGTAIATTRSTGEARIVRPLMHIAGEWHQSAGNHARAIEDFSAALAMAREVGVKASETEAAMALSLVRLGQEEAALQAVARAEGGWAHDGLAAVYAALGDTEAARGHAVTGYMDAWGDGPPFAHHWELERCRDVLRALGEPEPVLPPFDPDRIGPFPFEPALHAALDRHAAERRRAEGDADPAQ